MNYSLMKDFIDVLENIDINEYIELAEKLDAINADSKRESIMNFNNDKTVNSLWYNLKP